MNNTYNDILKEGRMMRMVSMLQPLGARRRLNKVSYLFLNSDFLTDQSIKKINNKCPEYIQIDNQFEDCKKARRQLSNIVKQDVEKISKVFNQLEKEIVSKEKGVFLYQQYCMDSNSEIEPQDMIKRFFASVTVGKEVDGFVIYFSGLITDDGVHCMAFQIKNKVYLLTVHQILELWRQFLNGYKERKHLFLIIESPGSSSFLDQIHASKDRVDQYNVSFLFSEREKRTSRSQFNSYLKQYEEDQKVIKQRVNYEDKTPQNFTLKQDEVWKIQDYASCSGFTAALCEHLLSSPPKRIEELYQSRKEFYLNRYVIQPGFYGFAMKNYLDFGWYMDINYYRIQQQSSITFYGIKRSNFNLPMEQISIEQEQHIYKGFNYFGLVKNKNMDILIHDPLLIQKQKELEQQNELNKIKEEQVKSNISQQSVIEDQNFEISSEENNLTRNCNGFQIYENEGKYLGQWFNNKQNGLGVAIYKNGDSIKLTVLIYKNIYNEKLIEVIEMYDLCYESSEENLKMLIFQQNQPKQEIPDIQNENEEQKLQVVEQPFTIPDVTQLPQYEEFKEDLNDLNPDMKEDNIQPQDVEFLLKHAVCKVEIKEEEKIQKEQKTSEVIEQIDNMLDDFDNINLNLFRIQLPQQPQEQKDQQQKQDQLIENIIQQEEKIQVNNVDALQEKSPAQQKNQQIQQNSAELQASMSRLALIPLAAMKEYYKKQEGIDQYVSNEKVEQDMSQQFKQSMLNIGQAENKKFKKIRMQDDSKVSFNKTILDEDQKEKFIKKFKKNDAKSYGCKSEDLIIFGLTKRPINVEFKLRDELYVKLSDPKKVSEFLKNKCNYNGAQLIVHNLLEHATLEPENCDPNFNNDWSKEPEGKISYRGGISFRNKGFKQQHYIYPKGWKGYGLNISKYQDKEWIGFENGKQTLNSTGQWIVLYHGTSIQGVEGITKEGFKFGQNHKFAGAKCRITGKIIDKSSKCVYLTDDANVAGNYSTPFQLNEKIYKMVFQCRVNPKVVRSPKDQPDYYIVEERSQPQQNIRPYRILLKKLDEQESKKHIEDLAKIHQNLKDLNEAQFEYQKQIREKKKEIVDRTQINYHNYSSGSDTEQNQTQEDEQAQLLKNIQFNGKLKNK
ncbi:hypothetical protein ABPG72_015267 [Tetrahymena utriculariae]